MLAVSFIAAVLCFVLSIFSKSACKWSLLLLGGLAVSFGLGSFENHPLIWIVDTFMMLAMIGMRQDLHRSWQEPVLRLQVVLITIYLVYAVFAGRVSWIIDPLIDLGNLLYLAQVLMVAFGGVVSGRRNLAYIRDQRRAGNKLPWLRTAWRMT